MVSFTYDSEGLVTLYFILTISGFVLIPVTYAFWPRAKDDEEQRLEKLRQIHVDSKWFHKKVQDRRQKSSPLFVKAILGLLWAIFAMYVYKAMQIEVVRPDWSPYEELAVAKDADKKVIKKAYRTLSIKFHPDKCDTEEFGEDGCNERFMLVKQAYEILKDDEKRIVWDETGDTGEVHSMQLGLALPEWIVKKENAPFVLGCYVLMFMIILPTVVGRWWYKSIKFNTDSILLSTSNMFQYFIYRSPTMQFKRLLQILTSANEFDRNHNKEIKLRHSDSVLMPRLIQQLPADNSAKQQNNMPMNRSYSIKARSLVLAHLHGLELEDATLQEDQDIVLSKCTMLIYSMIQTMGEFVQFHQMGKLKKAPSIATIDQTMKLSALLVQGIKDGQNPIFQLPYLNDRNLSYLQKKKIKEVSFEG